MVTLTLAGDIVMHTPLNSEVLQADGSYDYALLFEDVAHYVSGADY
ncbi:MAG TPA: CapA family protein, partial [Candidatus Scatomorpha merdipullorum]|nr:CapA family protein [Candidatus Scatomorpha merdipullorum]